MSKNNNQNSRYGFNPSQRFVNFEGRCYAVDFDRMVEVCTIDTQKPRRDEVEISNVYDRDDDDELKVSQKIEREMMRSATSQNEIMLFDIVKLMMMSLIGDEFPEEAFAWTFGTALSFNTLLNLGVIYELDNNNSRKINK